MYQDTIAEKTSEFVDTMNHYNNMQQELGFSSVWSIYDCGAQDADFAIFNDKIRKVVYEYTRADATVEELLDDIENGTNNTTVQVSSLAVNGTIKALWAAAESCIAQSQTHHMFIEDFEINADGTLTLIAGS